MFAAATQYSTNAKTLKAEKKNKHDRLRTGLRLLLDGFIGCLVKL